MVSAHSSLLSWTPGFIPGQRPNLFECKGRDLRTPLPDKEKTSFISAAKAGVPLAATFFTPSPRDEKASLNLSSKGVRSLFRIGFPPPQTAPPLLLLQK